MTLKISNVAAVVLRYFSVTAEFDKKILVLRISILQKAHGCMSRCSKLSLHATADIKNDAQAYGNVFHRHGLNLLFNLVFPKLEMLRSEICKWSVL